MSETTAGGDPEVQPELAMDTALDTATDTAMDTAMDTGSDAGEPGERNEVLTGPEGANPATETSFDVSTPDAELAAAIADDAPLPPEPGERPRDGGDQGDGLAPLFIEPDA